MTTILRARWNLPAGEPRERVERLRLYSHVPRLKALPGLRRLDQLRYLREVSGVPPLWWRGEVLYFDEVAALEEAASSPAWRQAWGGLFGASIAGPLFGVYEVDEDYVPAAPAELAGAGVAGTCVPWPALRVDELSGLRRHTVMRALEPDVREPASARDVEIRVAALADLDRAFSLPADSSPRSSSGGRGPDFYLVEDEWHASGSPAATGPEEAR
jgi:hypothetical protein